jgi:hypothetical protein
MFQMRWRVNLASFPRNAAGSAVPKITLTPVA